MFPKTPVLIDTSEAKTPPDAHAAEVASGIHASSSRSSPLLKPESRRTSLPPAYSRKSPLDNPFSDQHATERGSSLDKEGVQEILTGATATCVGSTPQPSAPGNPVISEVIIEEDLIPPLPSQPAGIQRGLQIPSRVSRITYGFKFPKILLEHGVTRAAFRIFKHELEAFAHLTWSQHFKVWGCHIVAEHFLGPIPGKLRDERGNFPSKMADVEVAFLIGWKMEKHMEHGNFNLAYVSGQFKMFEDRWNGGYFHALGLHVRVEPPGIGFDNMNEMDVTSTKLFRYHQKVGIVAPAPGVMSKNGVKKEYRYQVKEGRYRMKAARKGRIIFVPHKAAAVDSIYTMPRLSYSGAMTGKATNAMVSGASEALPLAVTHLTKYAAEHGAKQVLHALVNIPIV